MRKKAKTKQGHSTVVQPHHVQYASLDGKTPEIVVRVWKGEHWLLTWMNRRKRISKGFIFSLKFFIEKNEKYAEELK